MPNNEDDGQTFAVGLARLGDWTSWSSAPVLLALLPVSLACLSPVAALMGAMLPGGPVTWACVYFASLGLVFVPGLQVLQTWLVGIPSREPTVEERGRLEPAWADVAARLGAGHKRRYRLRVIDDGFSLNAAAAGGHLVMVTSRALRELPDDQLRALLAHEAGHHAGMHPLVLLARAWLYRPIAAVSWLAAKLHNLLAWLTGFDMRAGVYVALVVVILLIRGLFHLLRAIVAFADLIFVFFGRQAEYRADRFAAEMGFGEPLVDALATMSWEQPEEAPAESHGSFLDTLKATHPPTMQRIERIRDALA